MIVYKTTRDKKVITGYSSLVLGLTAIMVIFILMDDSIWRLLFFGFLFIVGMIYFVSGMVFISYEFKEEGLLAQAGFIGRVFPYESITAIEPMGSPFSGNERILGSSQGFTIKHTGPKGEVKISPERMEEFKRELVKHAPQLEERMEAEIR
ncbi:hypothetical protein JCM19045_3007 [Bacillus sp. JCM 19045]|nr:hypothetical protein JCM19045_3007 [Bacillus sp. JCM 19045]